MTKYVIKRILLAFVSLIIIMALTFILMKLLPLKFPAGALAAQKFAFMNEQVRQGYAVSSSTPLTGYGSPTYIYDFNGLTSYFYMKPVMTQFGSWVANILTKGDWGTSTAVEINRDAMVIIMKGLPYTIGVNAISVVVSIPLGIALGIWAALKKNKPTDHIISTLVMIFISVPSFVLISFLILTFGFEWHLLPTEWPKSYASDGQKALGYIIPVISLSFGSICGYCRFTRAELTEILSSDYLLLARTKGLTKSQAIVRHALRNAMVPILPSILAQIIGVISGSMILENLYNIPGIGSVFLNAMNLSDYNVLMVDMAVFTLIGLLAGIVLDLSYGFLDPRIRMGAKK